MQAIIEEVQAMTDSSAETAPSPSDLDESATMTVADALKIILANSYAVYLKTKNFHWHVSGPYFRDYHLLLDEQAAEILAATDAMAERARKTGNTTIRSIGDIARHQTIKDNDAEFVTPQDMLAELRADNLHMVESLRRAKDVADQAKDNATSGLIDTWIWPVFHQSVSAVLSSCGSFTRLPPTGWTIGAAARAGFPETRGARERPFPTLLSTIKNDMTSL